MFWMSNKENRFHGNLSSWPFSDYFMKKGAVKQNEHFFKVLSSLVKNTRWGPIVPDIESANFILHNCSVLYFCRFLHHCFVSVPLLVIYKRVFCTTVTLFFCTTVPFFVVPLFRYA